MVAGALLVPAGAVAGPLQVTSFVRGTAVEPGSDPGPTRAFDGDGVDDLLVGTESAGATGSVYQLHSISNLKITDS